MAFIPTPGVAMFTPIYRSIKGTTAINRLYAAWDVLDGPLGLNEIAQSYADWFTELMRPALSNKWFLDMINVRAMNEAEGIQTVFTDELPLQGQFADADSNPYQVSYTVTLQTGLTGRSARGRLYGIGMAQSYHDGNRLNDSAQASFQTIYSALLTQMAEDGHAIQIVSFHEGGVPRTEGRPLPAVAATVRFPLATQRRRLT